MITTIRFTSFFSLIVGALLIVSGCSLTPPGLPADNRSYSTVPQSSVTIPDGAGDEVSVSQSNAQRMASNYISTMAFSRSGLIEQLQFEGFTEQEATQAVDALNVDWNSQAAKKAKEYLDIMPFSRISLIQQLEFEGFTTIQAESGVTYQGL